MKKINLIILIFCICTLAISTWVWADMKACGCSQTPPVDNSIPGISQPTPPSNPSSPVNDTPTENKRSMVSSKTALVDYSLLTITQFALKDGRYQVDGITDLPPGTRLIIALKTNPETTFNLQKSIEVQNGSFTAFFRIPSGNPTGNQEFLIEVVCNPQKQSSGVSSRIDRYGKNLVGEEMVILGKVHILKYTELFDLI